MKNKFTKLIYAILVVLTFVLSASVLWACNKDTEAKRRERDRLARIESVTAVENVFLNSVNEAWSVDLDNSKLAELDGNDNFSAADYIVAAGWTELIGDILINSSLQTGKLQTLATVAQSEEGKALIDNFSENSELILPLLKRVDFTPTDISNLVYDLLCALAEKSGATFDGIVARAQEIRAQDGVSAAMYQNMNTLISDMSAAKESLVPTAAEREEMLTAFENAKEPMGALIEFVYNMSFGTQNDGLLNILFGGEGALAGISNGEIITIIGTLRENIADLKDALAGDAIAYLNGAFGLIINKFDGNSISSVLYAQIVQYAKTAYMLVDVMPFMCDLAYSASEVFMDDGLIGLIKDALGNEINSYAQSANVSIIMAKLMAKVTDEFSQQTFESLISDICEQSMGDYRKSMPLVLVDVLLNASNIFEQIDGDSLEQFDWESIDRIETVHPEIVDENLFGVLINTLILALDNQMEKFKAAYEAYSAAVLSGKPAMSEYTVMRNIAGTFERFGMENRFNTSESTIDAAQWYIQNAERIINNVVDENNLKVKEDIVEFINDYYAENSEVKQALVNLSNMPLLSEDISETEFSQKYFTLAVKSKIATILMLINAE